MGQLIKIFALFSLMALCSPILLHCQEVEVTIDEHDKKEIILRLEELKVRRDEVKMLQSIIDRDSAQDAREKELNDKQVAIISQERDIWKEKADSYKKAWEDATRGRSKKCWVGKILTIGILRCN